MELLAAITLKFRQAAAFQNLSFKKAVYSLGGQKAHKVKKGLKVQLKIPKYL